MEDGMIRELMVRGVAAAKARDIAEAQRYLERVLGLEPPLETRAEALLWLAEICPEAARKRDLVESVLAIEPAEPRARRMLAILKGELDPDQIVDPDRMPDRLPQGDERADARRFTCPNCGGRMVFSADGQALVCEYCASQEKLAKAQAAGLARPPDSDEQNFLVAMATAKGHLQPVQRKTFSCQGCGCTFILPPQQLTLTCPYCESTYVVDASSPETAELASPAQLIPFSVNETQAKEAIRAWLRSLRLRQPARVTGGVGLYLPAWTFDLGGTVSFHYEVKVQNEAWGARQVGRDTWETRRDEQLVYYDDLLIPATQRLPAACIPSLAQYDKKQLVEYDERYLSDWPAETYQIRLGDAALEARAQVFKAEQEKARGKLLGQQVRDVGFSSLGMIVESYKLVLLPAWLAHYTVEDKRYDLIVNGQTGQVLGSRPLVGVSGWIGKLVGNR
jgi:hypothetical protein